MIVYIYPCCITTRQALAEDPFARILATLKFPAGSAPPLGIWQGRSLLDAPVSVLPRAPGEDAAECCEGCAPKQKVVWARGFLPTSTSLDPFKGHSLLGETQPRERRRPGRTMANALRWHDSKNPAQGLARRNRDWPRLRLVQGGCRRQRSFLISGSPVRPRDVCALQVQVLIARTNAW